MTMIGRCCHCSGISVPPFNDCTAAFYRIVRAEPTPGSSVPPGPSPCFPGDPLCDPAAPGPGPIHDPSTDWYWHTFEPPGNPISSEAPSVWASDLSALPSPPDYDGVQGVIAPMRYLMEYATGDNVFWDRGDFNNDGKPWPIQVSNLGNPPSGTSVHSVDGRFATNSHIQAGQFIADGPPNEGGAGVRIFDHGGKHQNGLRSMYLNYDVDTPFVTGLGRIRFMRQVIDGVPGTIIDVIPPESVNVWTYGQTDTRLYEKSGPFTAEQKWGEWRHLIPLPFTGGQIEWDIWMEFRGEPPGNGRLYLEEDTELEYNFKVLPDWDPATEDWELTIIGGDWPTTIIKFSDMTETVIDECSCYGKYTPSFSPWNLTELEITFSWDSEVAMIYMSSASGGDEFGPYNTADETYLSQEGAGMTLYKKWFDDDVSNNHYSAQTARGYWDGLNATFPQGINAQQATGSYAADLLTGNWPTSISITRTTQ